MVADAVVMKSKNESLPKSGDKRPPSALSTGSTDSGVFPGAVVSSQPTEPSSAVQTGPPSPTAQINSLIYQTANLIAVNEQLRKEIAENHQLQSMQQQMRNLNTFVTSPEPIQQAPAAALTPPNSGSQRLRGERRMQKPESYKTVICQAWLESKTCSFAENCRFAHGEEELRPSRIEPRQNNKYKTKLCDKYTTTGLCPYGKRCLFIHPDHGPNAYIRADKLFEVSQRHALADLRDQMETHILSGRPAPGILNRESPKQAAPPVPSTPTESSKTNSVPFGSTPVSMRGSRFTLPRNGSGDARPHPSWPLEPATFFGDVSQNNNNKMVSRPVSPFDSMLMGATTCGTVPYTILGPNSTPGGASAGYISGGSTPFTDTETSSPFQYIHSQHHHHLPTGRLEEDSFSMMPHGFEHLVEDITKHLELW